MLIRDRCPLNLVPLERYQHLSRKEAEIPLDGALAGGRKERLACDGATMYYQPRKPASIFYEKDVFDQRLATARQNLLYVYKFATRHSLFSRISTLFSSARGSATPPSTTDPRAV